MAKMYCGACREFFEGDGCPPYSVMEKKIGDEWVHVQPITLVELHKVEGS